MHSLIVMATLMTLSLTLAFAGELLNGPVITLTVCQPKSLGKADTMATWKIAAY